MQSRLEDVLREKERELKLHQKFVSLARFCEEEIFPFTDIPLRAHIETLGDLVERLIPEPKDRREEMFSGELFALLCTLYFHDIGAVDRPGFAPAREILTTMGAAQRTLILSYEIGRRLEIPERAVELVNSLIFSARKMPLEWEIAEGASKAIVRNGRMLKEIFNFAHLLWDVFYAGSGHAVLRRFPHPDFSLPRGEAALAIDSKEGVISVMCKPGIPYQVHVLTRVREHVESFFHRFRESVNGRLGFQYRQIVWDIAEGPEDCGPTDPAGPYPSVPSRDQLYLRWEEASQLLDKLFRYRHVIVVGDRTTGKTTMINSFVVPQLRHISPNVFSTEIWDHPVHEIREAIERVGRAPASAPKDIISACNRLCREGSCFFVLDGCERLKTVSPEEEEKFERFVEFCLDSSNAFLVVIGDKEEFFAWHEPFKRITLSAIFEVSPVDCLERHGSFRTPEIVQPEMVGVRIEEILKGVTDREGLREVASVLAGDGEKTLRRYSLEEIRFETCMPKDRIGQGLKPLLEKGIVRSSEVFNTVFYALPDRRVREHLYRELGLDQFAEKGRLREALRHAGQKGQLLSPGTLDMVEGLSERMMFTREEMGLVLASMVCHGRDWTALLTKAVREVGGFDYEHVLPLLAEDDAERRERALRLLARLKDDGLVNPLLAHLRRETEPELRRLLVEGFVTIGKRRTIVALMNTLTEMAAWDMKLRAIDYVYSLPARTARELLLEIAEVEKDPEVMDRIDYRLSRLEE
jgi:DNA-binding transcriptional ArsR family regulator